MRLGYALSSEEHGPKELVRWAVMAEEAGFDFVVISDHYHPWTDRQGNSPFVWSVLGGIASATSRIEVGTGVTCPTMRYHPAVIAQAAATVGAMMPGRFFLGLGTGENLNEHILGRHWPEPRIRLQMLEEAVEVIQYLWQGGWHSHHGRYFTVEYARVYTLPDPLPKVLIAAAGRNTATLAGRCDGLIAVEADHDLIEHFTKAGGAGKRAIGGFKVSWAHSTEQARRTAREWWPNGALPGELGSELPLPRQFEQVTKLVSEDRAAGEILCGPDAVPHMERIRKYREAGFDSVYVHQVGPDQEGFLRFYEREVMPLVRELRNEPRKAA